MRWLAVLAASLALSIPGGAAHAQVPGDSVRIETSTGPVEGTLVDRLPQGYLVNKGKASVMVPYVNVRSIAKLAPAPLAPMVLPAATSPAPAPAKPAVPPAVPGRAPPAPTVPAAPAPDTSFSGLATDPAPVAATPVGVEPPAPPPVPVPEPVQLAPPVMVPVPALPAPPRALPPRPEPKLERRSKLLMGTGIAFVILGAAALVTGAVLVIDGTGQSTETCEPITNGQHCYPNENRSRLITAGQITVGASAGAAVLGATTWAIGGKRVPAKDAAAAELSVGPGNGALTLRF